jgi:hypothetical protein
MYHFSMFHFQCINQIHNILISNNMNLNVFSSLYSREHTSAAIAAIFRLMLILQAHKGTNVVSCVTIIQKKNI